MRRARKGVLLAVCVAVMGAAGAWAKKSWADTSPVTADQCMADAENGDMVAQYQLGMCYWAGKGVKKDKKAAFEWIKKSAEQGYDLAQNDMGAIYSKGMKGVKKDLSVAVHWFSLAADQGNALAQNNLGLFYSMGKGVQRDYAKAAELFALAADQGHADAMNNLGTLYYNGLGVMQDKEKGKQLWEQAAELGSELAQKTLKMLNKMSNN